MDKHQEQPDVFPPSFPGYAQLLASGITKRSQLQGKTIEELERIKDIGPEIAQRIHASFDGQASDQVVAAEIALQQAAAVTTAQYPDVPPEPSRSATRTAYPPLSDGPDDPQLSQSPANPPFPFGTPAGSARPLRTDGPTLAEYVARGYKAENYPPAGYAAR